MHEPDALRPRRPATADAASSSEELQAAKAELLAANEALRRTSAEIASLRAERARLDDDLANVLGSSGIPLVLVDRDGRIRRLSPTARDVFGVTDFDLGRPIDGAAVTVKMLPGLGAHITDVLESGQPYASTAQNAEGRWYECTIRPYVSADDRVDGVVITALDVDAARRAEQGRKAARRYAASIVDSIKEALVVVAPDLVVKSVNRAFTGLFRRSAQEVEGRRLDALGVPVLAAPVLMATLETLDAERAISGIRVAEPDAELGRRLFEASVRRIQGTGLALVAIDDVTVREEAREAVRRAELGFREMLLDAGEAIIMADADRQTFFANRAAEHLFGYGADEILSCPLNRLLPDLDVAGALARVPLAFGPASRDFVGLRKGGSTFLAEVAVSRTVRDQHPAIVVFVNDVTEEREAQKKVQEYQERLQQMAFEATLSEEQERRRLALALHDRVGQLLALARLRLASVRGESPGSSQARLEQIDEIIEEAIAEARSLTFDLSPPILYDLGLKPAVMWLAEDFERKYGIRVTLDRGSIDERLDEVTSAVTFRSIRELLMNVVKHANVTHARVSLTREGDYLVVEIADEGAGFAVDGSAHEPGFGLLSVRQQVGRLGGLVDVDSAHGRGTRVRLHVPLPAKDPTKSPSEPP
jgi:PAS domain S-box-containing protein